MAPLVRPPALHICAVSGAGGGREKWAPQPRQSGGNGGRALDLVLGVLRRDGEFLQAAAGASLRDVFWLRFLEKKQQQQRKQPKPKPKPAQQQQMLQQQEVEVEGLRRDAPAFPPPAYQPGLSCVELMAADFQALKVYAGSAQRSLARRFLGSKGQSKTQQQPKPKPQEQQKEQQPQILQPPVFPPPSYPPGLSCMELMMADLEALKLYINYYSAILTTPLPQHYDPNLLAQYFASRPHVLAFRTIQILPTSVATGAMVSMLLNTWLASFSRRCFLTLDLLLLKVR